MTDEKDPTQLSYDPGGPDNIDQRLNSLFGLLRDQALVLQSQSDVLGSLFANQEGQNRQEEQGGDPTRMDVITRHRNGDTVEYEWDSIHSVEITNTAKDGPRVSKIKLYGCDASTVAGDAAEFFIRASRRLAEAYLRDLALGDEPDAPSDEATAHDQ